MRVRMGSAALTAVAAAALGMAGCATEAAAGKSDGKARNDDACVFSSTLNDYQPLDNERLILWAPGHRQPYLVTLSFPSQDLKWGIQVGFEDRDRNGLICGFGPDQVVIPRGMPVRISIKSMEKITPEHAKQLIDTSRMKPPKKPSPEASM
ncbi:MAG: DUF6491 family protein [Steroidobacteraceae bacterium]